MIVSRTSLFLNVVNKTEMSTLVGMALTHLMNHWLSVSFSFPSSIASKDFVVGLR